MSDMFDILPQSQMHQPLQAKTTEENHLYLRVQNDFICHHLGYYCNKFIDAIAQEAFTRIPEVEVLSIHKMLKEVMKKFMMNDLELVYLGHVASMLKWNFKLSCIESYSKQLSYQCELLPAESQNLTIFCHLVAFFVKKYIGDQEHCTVIASLLQTESQGNWERVYEEWLKICPQEMFRLSPRKINQLFWEYTKGSQSASINRNYNKMVDQIMELSTTYAMIPGETKQNHKRKKNLISEPQEARLEEPFLFGRKILKIDKAPSNQPQTVSKLFDFNPPSNLNNFPSMNENSFLDANPPKPKRQIKLGFKGNQQTRVNKHVTDMLKDSPVKDMSINKKYIPQSTIGMMEANINFFDSKMFSSGQDIIPYTLRSNSNIYRSKLFE